MYSYLNIYVYKHTQKKLSYKTDRNKWEGKFPR